MSADWGAIRLTRAIADKAAGMSSHEFLRSFAEAYVTNTVSGPAAARMPMNRLMRQLVLEYLHQGGGEGLLELAIAFGIDLKLIGSARGRKK